MKPKPAKTNKTGQDKFCHVHSAINFYIFNAPIDNNSEETANVRDKYSFSTLKLSEETITSYKCVSSIIAITRDSKIDIQLQHVNGF
ncbi:hypothetical protein TNCT_642931 [Trichonephila clavata]|uniref:Uncharacterized protein n=1 Tax=Trichonephila clavata TaxID=2740835 RepID=A0A8X6LL39_TRICU|nr:hypothetical protein TNCT_642931 [Trichonephila clavata]